MSSFIEMKEPVVGEPITAAGFGSVVKNNVEYVLGQLQQSSLNIPNSSFELPFLKSSLEVAQPTNWATISGASSWVKVSNTNSLHGAQSLELKATAGATRPSVESDFFEVAGQGQLVVRWAEFSSSTAGVPDALTRGVRVDFYDSKSDSSATSAVILAETSLIVAPVFTLVSPVTVTIAPATSRYAKIVLTGPNETTGHVNFDALEVYHAEDLVAEKISVLGDLSADTVTLAGGPTSDLHAATKQYVDAKGMQVVTAVGLSTGGFTAPVGVSKVYVQVIGGGAGGSGTDGGGGGGGAGGVAEGFVTVIPGNSYDVYVGAGGAGNITTGISGGQSYFNTATTVRATGGTGATGVSPGAGGVGTHGSYLWSKGGGLRPVMSSSSSSTVYRNTGGDGGGEAGGKGGNDSPNDGYGANSFGCGGGGGGNYSNGSTVIYGAGGPGASGVVIIRW